MYEIPECGKFIDEWQINYEKSPMINFHKKQEGAEVDAKKSMEKAANIGDMMAYKKFKAQLWLVN